MCSDSGQNSDFKPAAEAKRKKDEQWFINHYTETED
jgi:hypothetical protein